MTGCKLRIGVYWQRTVEQKVSSNWGLRTRVTYTCPGFTKI